MEPLPHGQFGLVFQQAIDWQDRTLQSRRTLQLYWNHWSTPWIQEYPHYYRTRTRRKMRTCLVGHPSIEATDPAGHHLANRPLAGDRLRIAPSHRTWTFKTTVIKIRSRTTNHRRSSTTSWQDQQMGTHLPTNPSHPPVYHIWQTATRYLFNLVFPLPTIHVQSSTLGGSISMRSSLATNLSMPVSWKYSTSNSVSVFIVFAIYQNY